MKLSRFGLLAEWSWTKEKPALLRAFAYAVLEILNSSLYPQKTALRLKENFILFLPSVMWEPSRVCLEIERVCVFERFCYLGEKVISAVGVKFSRYLDMRRNGLIVASWSKFGLRSVCV